MTHFFLNGYSNIFSAIYQYPIFQAPEPILYAPAEIISIADNWVAIFGRPQAVNETVGVNETPSRARSISRSVSDSVGVSDDSNIYKQRTWKLKIDDTVGTSETTNIKKRQITFFVNKVFQTNLFDQDIFQKKWDQHRTISKVFQTNVFDSDIFSQGFNRFVIPNVFQTY